ncbi:MAG: glycosyltransferase [Chloroflexi bacterium]|nr:glycosyltransferase [Chloroflexota bacterium]MQC26759.1 glycosyltransferase [Chloroflexota bacterium]
MANITVLAVGSRGDVQPYVALGLGLQSAGHHVRLAAHLPFKDFVERHGLEFALLVGDPQAIVEDSRVRATMQSGRDPIAFLRLFKREGLPQLEQLNNDILFACHGADLILYSLLAAAGYHVAQKMGVPCMPIVLQPFSRTRAFPNLFIPSRPHLGGTFNYLSHVGSEQGFWQALRPRYNRWLKDVLGIQPEGFFGPYRRLYQQRVPFLYGYSRHVVPKPADWPDWYHVTGYWFLGNEAGWRPPPDLLNFLGSGPPPVYIGFGSMVGGDPQSALQMVLEALEITGQRGLLLRGWGGLSGTDLPSNVHMAASVPHAWLFPRVAAVVHHGGSGTTAAGLGAGVPSILIPHFADQPFWADRVHTLGLSPAPIPRRKLSADRLAHAIHAALNDQVLREKATALGEQIRAEDGVARASEIIHRHIC